jgi:ABC-type uncharacterized transport system ATPase component
MVQEQVGFQIQIIGAMKNRIAQCHLGHDVQAKDGVHKQVLAFVLVIVKAQDIMTIDVHLQCLDMKIHVDDITKMIERTFIL